MSENKTENVMKKIRLMNIEQEKKTECRKHLIEADDNDIDSE